MEREINELIHGYHGKQNKKTVEDDASSSDNSSSLLAPKRLLGPDDVCPICQEDLLLSHMSLIHCRWACIRVINANVLFLNYRYGCGNSVHLKCMKIWADHQKSTGEMKIHCPLCREEFGSLDVSPL